MQLWFFTIKLWLIGRKFNDLNDSKTRSTIFKRMQDIQYLIARVIKSSVAIQKHGWGDFNWRWPLTWVLMSIGRTDKTSVFKGAGWVLFSYLAAVHASWLTSGLGRCLCGQHVKRSYSASLRKMWFVKYFIIPNVLIRLRPEERHNTCHDTVVTRWHVTESRQSETDQRDQTFRRRKS